MHDSVVVNSYGLEGLVHQAALLSIRWTDIREMPIGIG